MKKLQRGISTNIDFIRAMKERGQDVKAEFPAETLRDQLDDLSDETKVTFESTDETVLMTVNDSEPGPVESVTVRIEVEGLDEGDVASGTIGDEIISEFPVDIVRIEGTVETLEVTCDGYNTYTEDITFNESKTITVTLAKLYDITFDFNGGEIDGETNSVDSFDEGEEIDINDYFVVNYVDNTDFVAPEGKQFIGLTTVKDDSSTLVDDPYVIDGDATLYAYWETIVCSVTIDFDGGTDPNGDTSMTSDIPYGTVLRTSDFPGSQLTAPEGMQYGGLTTDVSDPDAQFSEITITDDITVYVVWETLDIDLTIDLGNASYDGESSIILGLSYGETWTVANFENDYLADLTLPSHAHYVGITRVKDDDSTLIGSEETITLTENTTFYLYLEYEQN